MSLARISRSISPVKLEPNHHCESTSELLFGESVQVLEQDGQWCRMRSAHDGYDGYIETTACDFSNPPVSHWVNTRATFVFEAPDIKAPVVRRLLFGSKLSLGDISASPKFLQLGEIGFVWSRHCLRKTEHIKSSMIEIVQNTYLQAPYLWGGRSTDGCDCSGLVQMVAMARGFSLPRDSGDQEAALSVNVEYETRTAQDLVFWPGHVGVLKSPDVLLHATAHSMRCCFEPLQDVIDRAGAPSSIKRIGEFSELEP